MTKKFIPLLIIITLSGCAHQLFEESNETANSDENTINEPTILKPSISGVPATPKKRIAPKQSAGDAYNE
jgi:hypothetical protein